MIYYNELDKQAAAWLRELIKAGHLPDGEVDERDIRDIRPGDLAGFVQCNCPRKSRLPSSRPSEKPSDP